MWFVDKLGPAPGAAPSQSAGRPNGAAKVQAPPAAAARPQAAAKAAPPPEPEKKKKKGWF